MSVVCYRKGRADFGRDGLDFGGAKVLAGQKLFEFRVLLTKAVEHCLIAGAGNEADGEQGAEGWHAAGEGFPAGMMFPCFSEDKDGGYLKVPASAKPECVGMVLTFLLKVMLLLSQTLSGSLFNQAVPTSCV